MMRYMLDTNACIGIINDKPSALRQRLQQMRRRSRHLGDRPL